MSNNIISKISPTVRIICLFILSISLFLAKSIFLILFITTLTLVLMVITGKKVNKYVNIIKKVAILLLFFLIAYIIMLEYNMFNWLIFTYKLIVVTLLFTVFYLNIDFNQLQQSIYGCLKPLEKIKVNIEGLSFDITVALTFIKILISNSEKIFEIQKQSGERKINFKNYILPTFINSVNELNELQCHLKAKFYKLSYRKNNKFSKFILIVSIIIFVCVIFKEVIL